MTHEQVEQWIRLYVQAWREPGLELVASLFTPDATYSAGPYEPTLRGLEAIGAMWDEERASGEEFELSFWVVALDDPVAVVRLEVLYHRPQERAYRDLWVMRFAADGRCRGFEEWPFWPDLPIVGP